MAKSRSSNRKTIHPGTVEAEREIAVWTERLDRLWNQALHLVFIDDVFWQVDAIVRGNPTLAGSGEYLFFDWLRECYALRVAVGLRTLVDADARNISFGILLMDMAKQSQLLTRQRHCALLKNLPPALANEGFDKIAGKGQAHIPPSALQGILKDLETAIAPVRTFVNQHVAHVSSNPKAKIPTTDDVRQALKVVGSTLDRCLYTLKGGVLMSAVPAIQSNWLKVFRSAWLPKGTRVPDYVHLDDFKRKTP